MVPERFSEAEAEAYVARTCFKTGPPEAVGVELEWLLHDAADPVRPVSKARLDAALAAVPDLPSGRVTVEPGGQVELSSNPLPGLAACVDAVGDDLAALRAAFAGHGLRLVGDALDPVRQPCRLLHLPRYDAMETFFDRDNASGRLMMCSTASVQVCVDAGPELTGPRAPDFRTRWDLAHTLGPVLVAAFANSPFRAGRPNGYRCGRQAVWACLDPSRTASAWRPGGDPRTDWARFALDARVLCIRTDGTPWPVPRELTFRAWLRGDGPSAPTADDLAYHLTTLFPPVRPRGHLELRTVDAQGGDHWVVPVAVVSALLDDPVAADTAAAAAEPVAADPAATERAARDGLADPALAGAAAECFAAALGALDRLGAAGLRAAVERFAARYVDCRHSPADERLARWRRTGSVHIEEAIAC
jgi:glutamate--cysteine ligase